MCLFKVIVLPYILLEQEVVSNVCAGIDVDIDVEHEGQRTKVTPPSQSGSMEEDMEVAGANSGGGASSEGKASGDGEASGEGGTSEGAKVSQLTCVMWSRSLLQRHKVQ